MKLADYSQAVTADQLDAALRAGGFEAVAHYLGDDFVLREENPDVVTEIRRRGWPQTGIFVVRAPSSVNAAGDIGRAGMYGYPPGSQLYLDVEPSVFDLDPAGWARVCDAWAPAIRSAGYLAGIYGVDRTCAACGNQMDRLWRAVPGMCDPAAAGPQGLNPAFKPGARMVQCGFGVFGGVEMDVNYSQFSIGAAPAPTPPQEDDDMGDVIWLPVEASSTHGPLQYWFWRRHEPDGMDSLVLNYYDGALHSPTVLRTGLRAGTALSARYWAGIDQVHVTGELVDGSPFDRYTVPGGPWYDVVGLGGGDDAQPSPLVDVNALAAALAPHLQAVDEAKLAADLEAVLPAADAAAVKAALAKALGA